jgi:hypothetical protein
MEEMITNISIPATRVSRKPAEIPIKEILAGSCCFLVYVYVFIGTIITFNQSVIIQYDNAEIMPDHRRKYAVIVPRQGKIHVYRMEVIEWLYI